MSTGISVLQIAKHFDPDTGGIETVTLNISEMLLRQNIRADVLCTEMNGPYVERDRGYRVIRCPADVAFGNKRLSWRYVTKAWALEHDYDCAIVHMPNPLGVIAALKWRKPVILLWHADIPQPLIRTLTAPLDRALARRAAAVIGPTPIHIAGSQHADVLGARAAIIRYPFDRSMIPKATGTTEFAERLRAFRRGRALSISVGRLVSYKGFDILIEAARDFDDHLCSLIVGAGPLAAQLAAQIATAQVEDRVMLAGALSPDELADAFAQARVGCMPSVTAAEMYGIAQVETLAAGIPMVSTSIPRSGVPFVNRDGETGLIVPPGDSHALAGALQRLTADDVLWERLHNGALRSIADEHDVGPVSERYAALIRDVTALKPNTDADD